MSKTNRDRAQKVILGLLHDDPGLEEAYEEVIAAALDKAEKRGRRKERRRIHWEENPFVCEDCGGNYLENETILPDGELGCSCQAAPSIDAEKVRGMIREYGFCKSLLGRTGKDHHNYDGRVQDANRSWTALLAALGLE